MLAEKKKTIIKRWIMICLTFSTLGGVASAQLHLTPEQKKQAERFSNQLGMCYDITGYDPLDPKPKEPSQSIFISGFSDSLLSNNYRELWDYNDGSGMEKNHRNIEMIENSIHLSSHLGLGGSFSAGIPGIFSHSISGKFNSTVERLQQEKHVYAHRYHLAPILSLWLKFDEKTELPLGTVFKRAVESLLDGSTTEEDFIERYGTHIAAEILVGGFYQSHIYVEADEFYLKKAHGYEIEDKAEAEFEIEGVPLKLSRETDINYQGDITDQVNIVKIDGESLILGGKPASKDYNEWSKTLYKFPKLIRISSFRPIYELFTHANFPHIQQDQLDKKRDAMKQAVTEYAKDAIWDGQPALVSPNVEGKLVCDKNRKGDNDIGGHSTQINLSATGIIVKGTEIGIIIKLTIEELKGDHTELYGTKAYTIYSTGGKKIVDVPGVQWFDPFSIKEMGTLTDNHNSTIPWHNNDKQTPLNQYLKEHPHSEVFLNFGKIEDVDHLAKNHQHHAFLGTSNSPGSLMSALIRCDQKGNDIGRSEARNFNFSPFIVLVK